MGMHTERCYVPRMRRSLYFMGLNREFYDLKNDPEEYFNLWDDPAAEKRKNAMIARCFDASVFTMDPHPPRLGPF